MGVLERAKPSGLRSTGSVEQLAFCLFGRDSRERQFMILNGFYDESGTHGDDSPATVMAGFVASVEDWIAFEIEWQKVLKAFDVPYFHAREFYHLKGPYKKWRGDRRLAKLFYNQLLYVIQQFHLIGSKSILREYDYVNFYLAKSFHKKERPDTRYALCFRSIALSISRFLHPDAWDNPPSDRVINFVLEAGHKNSGDAVRAYNELQKHLSEIGALSFGDRLKSNALQAADMLAYDVFGAERNYKEEYDEWISELEFELSKSKIPVIQHVVTQGDLKALRDNFRKTVKQDVFNDIIVNDELMKAEDFVLNWRFYYRDS